MLQTQINNLFAKYLLQTKKFMETKTTLLMENVGNLLREWIELKGIQVKDVAKALNVSTQLVYWDLNQSDLSTKKLKEKYLPLLELNSLYDFFELNNKTIQEISELTDYYRHNAVNGSEIDHLKHEIKMLHVDIEMQRKILNEKEKVIQQLEQQINDKEEIIKDKEAIIFFLKKENKE
jgi:4-diphosphocytidyl-2C-methyl-D-erythritol kinase